MAIIRLHILAIVLQHNYLITVTRVIAYGHFPWYEVLGQIQHNETSSTPQESILVDLSNETCVLLYAPELQTLQTIITFPRNNVVENISVDVLAKDVDDCSSPAWAWFVGSNSSSFRECYNVGINKTGVFASCRVTCVCPNSESCQYLNFKYVFDQTSVNIKSAICDMKPIYGDVRVPYYGTDWTNSDVGSNMEWY